MLLKVNGKDHDLPDGGTAAQLLESLSIKRERVAVVVNENVVPRARLDETPLKAGDSVEVITMVGGG